MSLRRGMAAVGLAMALGVIGGVPAGYAADGTAPEQRLKAAAGKAAQKDCIASLRLVAALLKDKAFATLPESRQVDAYQLGAFCALQLRKDELAYPYAVEATRRKGTHPILWRVRLLTELRENRNAEAVATLEAMASVTPGFLNTLSIRWLYQLSRDVKPNPELRRRLLSVLAAPSYQPEEVGMTSDSFKRDYAALLADSGDKAGALALARTIEDPATLVDVSIDPRLRAALPAEFDGRAEVERSLAKAREVAASHPGSMTVLLEVSKYLRVLNRPEDALATLEAARPDGPQGAAFTDLDSQRNWWWDEMARTYQMLGRYDDAVAAFRSGIEGKEYGGLNVSQTINLSDTQLRFGHPADALATIAAFESGKYSISGYGEMQMRQVRGCAQIALGQAAAAKADLDYAVAHEKDAPDALMALQLCAGDIDAAAAAMIRRLDDPDLRSQALLVLSDFDPSPAAFPPEPYERRLHELKARPDVQAAIARAGGTRRYRLQGSDF